MYRALLSEPNKQAHHHDHEYEYGDERILINKSAPGKIFIRAPMGAPMDWLIVNAICAPMSALAPF